MTGEILRLFLPQLLPYINTSHFPSLNTKQVYHMGGIVTRVSTVVVFFFVQWIATFVYGVFMWVIISLKVSVLLVGNYTTLTMINQ